LDISNLNLNQKEDQIADRRANRTAKKTTNHIKKGGRRYSRQKAREEKERKKRRFQVFSVNENDKAFLSRVALVHWGESKEPLRYMFHHLTLAELKGFWWSTYAERKAFIVSECDRHHRLPGCQGGETVPENLSYVDKKSHCCYNQLISAVARWARIPVKKVRTKHTEEFLRNSYRHLKWLFSCSDTEKFRSIDSSLSHGNVDQNLNETLKTVIAKWSRAEFTALHVSDVHRFLEYMHPVIKRLALNHETNTLKTPLEFFRILNMIWLPVGEQIKLGRHGKASLP
jgi:hypothetical protein